MMIFHTLEQFLEELMLNPHEIFVHVRGKSCSVYIPEREEFLFLDGDFTGSDAQNRHELKRILREMGYDNVR